MSKFFFQKTNYAAYERLMTTTPRRGKAVCCKRPRARAKKGAKQRGGDPK